MVMSGSWLRSIILASAPALVILAILHYQQSLSTWIVLLLVLAVVFGASIAVRRRLSAEEVVMRRLNRLTAEAQTQLDAL
ncbi:MAG TPA: hypothetical protein DCL95_09495, partial [Rhodospirillaceae bacterium]|nr:hypothetical protein [Rhodospirillaceae bacterium]